MRRIGYPADQLKRLGAAKRSAFQVQHIAANILMAIEIPASRSFRSDLGERIPLTHKKEIIMKIKEAQEKITEAINADAEKVITSALIFNPEINLEVDAARKASVNIKGVAAVACRYALRGKTNEETILNMIKFAGSLTKGY
jgi:hypothetical protein